MYAGWMKPFFFFICSCTPTNAHTLKDTGENKRAGSPVSTGDPALPINSD